jgi:peptide/nickel transport system permease protein
MVNKMSFIKKAKARIRKRFTELSALNICWGASFIIAALLLNGSYDKETHAFHTGGVPFILCLLYLIPMILSFLLSLKVRGEIGKKEEISGAARKLGMILIPFAVTGNVFAAVAGFAMARKEKPVDYHLICFAFLNNLTVMLIAALNLFKATLAPMFWVSIGVFTGTLVLYGVAAILVLKAQKSGSYRRLMPLAVILVAATATGNIFSLLLGLVLIARIRNEGSRKAIEWVEILRRIYRNYMAVLGLFIIGVLLTLSVVSEFLFSYDLATLNDYAALMQPPSIEYPFGTDDLGRDIFTRIIFGARVSLIIGMVSTALPLVAGGLLGAAAGFYENKLDNVIMRILDVFFAVPSTLMAIAIIAAFGANMFTLIVALSISNIPVYARTMRAQVLVVSSSEFTEAAKACGRRSWQILIKHVIPNSLAPMIVRCSVSIGIAVLATSSLSYLGLGVEAQIPEWGNILRIGSKYLETNPYLAVYPGIFIIVLVLAFNFLGDGLRDALDPKLK